MRHRSTAAALKLGFVLLIAVSAALLGGPKARATDTACTDACETRYHACTALCPPSDPYTECLRPCGQAAVACIAACQKGGD